MDCENDERIDEDEAYLIKKNRKKKKLKENKFFLGVTQTSPSIYKNCGSEISVGRVSHFTCHILKVMFRYRYRVVR